MRAIVHDKYGPPDTLELRDIGKAAPLDGEVLVRVHAAGLHVGDSFALRGKPLPIRLTTGPLKPKHGVPGFDLAGRVEAVGRAVTRFRPGDEVFGTCEGACAEYVVTAADHLVPKPARLTFEEAAAVPTSALAALHALRDTARLEPGRRVLINGASGGLGTFAVQLAVSFGAEVTGVCGTANVDTVRSIGAHHVIDYTRQDFASGEHRYDVILDNIENRSLAECRRSLTPDGTLILNSGTRAGGLGGMVRLVRPLLLSPFLRQNLRRYVSTPKSRDLAYLADLLESGELSPVVGKTYPLSETAAALHHIETGHARGKTVITLDVPDPGGTEG
ncbi:NAD(P)-dependent alcohol dehydrogenase [Actinomadura madurae]|uniref:NAD(P)-dependent alcohol dehydrogenase n=1 Tax=Actinomadura madurae TaxID=1993 RepID=UPI00202615C3|nr:NAD(P)-dependent alcohol dehydrogenase [Actinomadura madurae]URN05197.1 NAD(P)-dependent alcohol dehydrogenase [Actinomadura madurae]